MKGSSHLSMTYGLVGSMQAMHVVFYSKCSIRLVNIISNKLFVDTTCTDSKQAIRENGGKNACLLNTIKDRKLYLKSANS